MSIHASSSAAIICHLGRFTTGGIISRSCNANPAPCAMARPSWSAIRLQTVTGADAASTGRRIEKWSTSLRWCCITTKAVLAAVEMALAEGVATKTHVLNLLHRLIDGKVRGL